jgi:hypothetical protein
MYAKQVQSRPLLQGSLAVANEITILVILYIEIFATAKYGVALLMCP